MGISSSEPAKPSVTPSTHRSKNILLVIDPQVDFHPGGSLAISTANEDSERTANMVRQHMREIDEIYITLDSHNRNHVAHGIFWTNSANETPSPFTLISYEDVLAEKWTPRNPKHRDHALQYTKFLKDQGKFTLCIWPEHCLIGTPGHAVVPSLNAALQEWTALKGKDIHYVHKGQNNLTEMYSAIKADFEIASDLRTQRDPQLMVDLQNTDRLLICGQALSHCVNFTFTDILETWPANERSSLILLTDACSPVGGCEDKAEEFVQRIKSQGCTLSTTSEVFLVERNLASKDSTHTSTTERVDTNQI